MARAARPSRRSTRCWPRWPCCGRSWPTAPPRRAAAVPAGVAHATHRDEAAPLAGLDASYAHLKSQLENVGLQPRSASAVARETLTGLSLGQAVFFQGSLAPVLARAAAMALSGARWAEVDVPGDMKDNAALQPILASIAAEGPGGAAAARRQPLLHRRLRRRPGAPAGRARRRPRPGAGADAAGCPVRGAERRASRPGANRPGADPAHGLPSVEARLEGPVAAARPGGGRPLALRRRPGRGGAGRAAGPVAARAERAVAPQRAGGGSAAGGLAGRGRARRTRWTPCCSPGCCLVAWRRAWTCPTTATPFGSSSRSRTRWTRDCSYCSRRTGRRKCFDGAASGGHKPPDSACLRGSNEESGG